MFTCTSSKGHGLWFVIGGYRSVLFVSYFKVRCLLCDRPVSGNNRLDLKLALLIFLIFLILVTYMNKATSAVRLCASFPSTKNPLTFAISSAILEQSRVIISAKPRELVTLWFALTPPSLTRLTEQKNPKSLRSLQYAHRHTTNVAVNRNQDFVVSG